MCGTSLPSSAAKVVTAAICSGLTWKLLSRTCTVTGPESAGVAKFATASSTIADVTAGDCAFVTAATSRVPDFMASATDALVASTSRTAESVDSVRLIAPSTKARVASVPSTVKTGAWAVSVSLSFSESTFFGSSVGPPPSRVLNTSTGFRLAPPAAFTAPA